MVLSYKIVNNITNFYIFELRLTEAHMTALAADCSDDEDDTCFEDNQIDADWQPPNQEESDAEDVLQLENMNSAIEFQEEDSDDDSFDEDNSAEFSGHFDSRSGTKWLKAPPAPSQTRRHNIVRQTGNNYLNGLPQTSCAPD